MYEEDQAISHEIPHQHELYSAAGDAYSALACYTDFLQPDYGDMATLSALYPLLEPVSWPLFNTNPTPPILPLTDGDVSLFSPASMDTMAATCSLDPSDASSPSELATPLVPSS
jgi:hypothetical protein